MSVGSLALLVVILCAPRTLDAAPAKADAGSVEAGADANGTDAAAPKPAPKPDAGKSRSERKNELEATLAALKALLSGKLPEGIHLEDLFSVDLTNEDAVTNARDLLAVQVGTLSERVSVLRGEEPGDGGAEAGDGAVADAAKAEVDAGKGASVPPTPTKTKPTAPKAPAKGDAGVADAGASADGGGDAGEVDAGEDTSATDLVLAELELEVASARLAFLSKPLEERKPLVSADAERKRLAVEKERAEAERDKALEEQRAAEAARRAALVEAEQARTEVKRAVATELARAEGVRGAQAAYKHKLAERRQALATSATERQKVVEALLERAKVVKSGARETDALYDDIVKALTGIREDVRAALDLYGAEPDVARYEATSAYKDVHDQATLEDRKKVDELTASLDLASIELATSARVMAWENLESVVAREHELNDKRIALLDRVTPAKHDAVLGFGPEGIAQARREMSRVALEARWYRTQFTVTAGSLPERVTEPVWIGKVTTISLLIGAIIALAIYVRRKAPELLERARSLAVRAIRRPRTARIAGLFIGAVRALSPELVLFASLYSIASVLGDNADSLAFAVPLRVLMWYAVYRLVTTGAHRGFAWVAATGTGVTAPGTGRSEKIQRSVRLVARYLFPIGIVLVVAAKILGKGYLYHLVRDFAWLGAVPLFMVLIRWWRNDIAEAYLKFRPKGRLADLVRSTRDQWHGFFVAVAAFLVVLGQVAVRAVQRFVLGFEQTRKALAFIFRRRLERQASSSVTSSEPVALPEVVSACFDEGPVTDETYAMSELQGLEVFNEALEDWKKDGVRGALLVVGERGFGKTSWLNAAAAQLENLHTIWVSLPHRVLTREAIIEVIARAVGVPASTPASIEAIRQRVEQSAPHVLVVDDAHHLLLRGVETFEAWATLTDIVEVTEAHAFWLASMDRFAYKHLSWSRPDGHGFRKIVTLQPWSEAQIDVLLQARVREMGLEVAYDDLVVDRMEGVDAEAQLVGTRRDYSRLIWDYADGSPRVAIRSFRKSLVPDEAGLLRVQLFRRPPAPLLESLSNVERFALAGVVWHATLTVEEAVQSLRYGRDVCAEALDRLLDDGVLEISDGRYRVTSEWDRPVVRYLRRKHLVEG